MWFVAGADWEGLESRSEERLVNNSKSQSNLHKLKFIYANVSTELASSKSSDVGEVKSNIIKWI